MGEIISKNSEALIESKSYPSVRLEIHPSEKKALTQFKKKNENINSYNNNNTNKTESAFQVPIKSIYKDTVKYSASKSRQKSRQIPDSTISTKFLNTNHMIQNSNANTNNFNTFPVAERKNIPGIVPGNSNQKNKKPVKVIVKNPFNKFF